MAEQLLNRAQVGAALQQVRRERVPQRVRTDAEPRAARRHVAPHQPIDAADGQPARRGSSRTAGRASRRLDAAAGVEPRRVRDERLAILQIRRESRRAVLC